MASVSEKKVFLKKKILALLTKSSVLIPSIAREAALADEEANACMGILRKKQLISTENVDGKHLAKITNEGKNWLKTKSPEEIFLTKQFPIRKESLKPEEQALVQELLRRRRVIELASRKEYSTELTKQGTELLKAGLGEEAIDAVTPQILASGQWKGKSFRRYDVTAPVEPVLSGQKHFVTQATEYARQIWLDMGFQEMKGDLIQPSFWNFDALFSAQDHPVREMQDTFFLKNPKLSAPPDKELAKKIKAMHETGSPLGSKAWGGNWSVEESQRNVLRTHTTVLSARTLAKLKKKDIPAKFFSLGKCFRNEALDWKHLFEFNQTDGIVVDKDANFQHLLGYLHQFFAKMGFPKARFRPAYFPYTEPSVEIDVFHEGKGTWIELGGAGMLRPEVTVPLFGEEIPVLAWGPGFDRIILDYYNITDIRDLYKNDLGQSRARKAWLREHANNTH